MSQKFSLAISGMNCQHCASKIVRALRDVAGVTDVEVGLSTRTAEITVERPQIGQLDLVAAVVNVGYGARPV